VPLALLQVPDNRAVMGNAVIGMLSAAIISIFLVPVTFYFVEKLSHRGKKGEHKTGEQPKEEGGEHA
jgi:HAE1 family hydrophobic/amphiphilic exporter-1